MGDGQRERIEIELTSHAPVGDRSAGDETVPAAAPAVPAAEAEPDVPPVVGTTQDDGPAWLGSERSRLFVTIAAVGVVGLLLGWMLGRSGDDEPATAPAATAGETPSTEAERNPQFEAADTLPETDVDPDDIIDARTVPPTPTARTEEETPDTTSAPAEPVERVRVDGTAWFNVALDDRLSGLEGLLVAVDRDRRLLEIDLATGDTEVRGRPLTVSVDRLVAAPEWVAVVSEGNQVVIDRADGERTTVGVADPWSLSIDTATETMWSSEPRFNPGPVEYVETGIDGEETGRTIEIPTFGWPIFHDGDAYLASIIGITYRIGPDGHEELLRGQLMAGSADVLLVSSCDEQLECGLRIVDRSTGDERWLPPGPGSQNETTITSMMSWFGRDGAGAISPDGRWLAAVRFGGASEELGVLDLESGEFLAVGGLSFNGRLAPWAWGPNGRFAFYLERSSPMVLDLSSGETFALSVETELSWTALAAVPSVAPDEAAPADEVRPRNAQSPPSSPASADSAASTS